MSTLIFLFVRVLHVVLAAMWFGALAFLVLFLMPSVAQSGPAGGQVMGTLVKRGLSNAMAAIAGTTVLSGIWLYWRFTGGFDSTVIHTHAGMAFGTGGLAGLVALIIGGSVVGRGTKEIVALAGQAASMPEGPERAAILQKVNRLRERTGSATRIVLALVTTALVLMTLAHYI